MIKVYKKIYVDNFHVIQCHRCGAWLVSASERDLLPEFAYCCCDEQQGLYQVKKKEVYRATYPTL